VVGFRSGAAPTWTGTSLAHELGSAVGRAPYTVLQCNDIERAHPAVLTLLAELISTGELVDGQCPPTDFRNALLLMESKERDEASLLSWGPAVETLVNRSHVVVLQRTQDDEVVSTREGSARAWSTSSMEVIMRDVFVNTGVAGAQGPNADVHDNTFTQVAGAAQVADAAGLVAALIDLQTALGVTDLPPHARLQAQTAAGNAALEGVKDGKVLADALTENVRRVGAVLKDANVVVEEGSTLWPTLQKVASLLGPLVGGAGVVAGWFGLGVPN